MNTPRCLAGWLARTTFVLAVVATAPLLAQRGPPRVGFVYPAGGRQGATFTVSVGGQNLNAATAVYFSGPGITATIAGYERPLTQKEINDLREKAQALQAKRAANRSDPSKPALTPEDEKMAVEIRQSLATRGNRQATPAVAETVTLQITLAADAPTGERELRLKTASGLSNPLMFCVGSLPETTDPVVTATANRPQGAARVFDPRATWTNPAGTLVTLPAVVNGQILPGEVDRFRFRARQGQKLTFVVAARELLPYLADAVPGWFQATLSLLDSEGRELAYNDDFRFHPDPVLLWEAPADGLYAIAIKDAIYRGREDFVYRITMGELPFITGISPLGGRGGGKIALKTAGWNLPLKEVVVDALDKPRGTFTLTLRNAAGTSNEVPFAVDDQAECGETEPNDSAPGAQALTLPAVVDGRIARPGDADVFSFEVAAGASIVAEVLARRLGSPLDSILEITDGDGKRIAFNDDFEDKGAGLLTHQSDSRVECTLPAAGKYFVRVADAQRAGGAEFDYRLRVGPPRPDFALRIVPSTINVRAGASAPLTAYVLRRDGYTGEILLGLHEAPSGFALSGARIPAGQDKVQLTLTAPSSMRAGPIDLKFIGVASIGGARVAHVAAPADDMMQAFAYHHLVTSQQMKVDVTGRATALRSLTRGVVKIPAGGTARIRVAAQGARLGEPRFELTDPIEGLSVKECIPGRDAVEVVIACDAAKFKTRVEGNLMLQSVAERRGGTTPAAKQQRNSLGIVPAIPFEIVVPAGTVPPI